MTKWTHAQKKSSMAREVFGGGSRIRVMTNGHQHVIHDSPFGVLELLRIGERVTLAAAETPPFQLSDGWVEQLTPNIRKHLEQRKLTPWRIVPTDDFEEVLRLLMQPLDQTDGEPPLPDDSQQPKLSPWMVELPKLDFEPVFFF